MRSLNSEAILVRLREEARDYVKPDIRFGTIERLVEACDAIENGEAAKVVHKPSSHLRNKVINATNVEKYIRSKRWRGPTRTTIAKEPDGLQAYVNAREEERKKPVQKIKPMSSQIEQYLGEIESTELRQFFRSEIEKRRQVEQKLKMLMSGLLKIPGIDIRSLLHPEKYSKATTSSETTVNDERRIKVKQFLSRLRNADDLRHLGLRREGDDILTINGTELILSSELHALHEIAGLP
jgi:hypothetical protein